MTPRIQVSREVLVATISYLQNSGKRGHEGVVLWLGRRSVNPARVTRVYQPEHTAAEDFFHIPSSSMRALMNYLDQHGISVLAQVHSHPLQAFHSKADDQWALVRHVGALSLVLPYFAKVTTPDNFSNEAAVFTLRQGNQWVEIFPPEIAQAMEIVP